MPGDQHVNDVPAVCDPHHRPRASFSRAPEPMHAGVGRMRCGCGVGGGYLLMITGMGCLGSEGLLGERLIMSRYAWRARARCRLRTESAR